jgi:hypothetical protein
MAVQISDTCIRPNERRISPNSAFAGDFLALRIQFEATNVTLAIVLPRIETPLSELCSIQLHVTGSQ